VLVPLHQIESVDCIKNEHCRICAFYSGQKIKYLKGGILLNAEFKYSVLEDCNLS